MNTEQVLQRMMKENTGRHFLDSGGAYGRHWEKNQERDFDSEPVAIISADADYGELEVTQNLYHWLLERLEYDSEMQTKFDKFAESNEMKDTHWLGCMEAFPYHLKDLGHDINGLYGEGEPITENSYNHRTNLSQTIQFTYFECDDDTYILLQVHGGCDVRGGYTAPKVFTPSNYLDEAILFMSDGYICCSSDHEHNWSTDDGYHWYDNGTCGNGYKNLETYDFSNDKKDRGNDIIFVDDNNKPHCPKCGGKLEAY